VKVLFRLSLAQCLLALSLVPGATGAELWINEVLFNPAGSDTPYEYIELRGKPNLVIPTNTYLLTVEGNAGANPGTVQNRFDLSGKQVGGNGFLVLLQASHPYSCDPLAAVWVNTNNGSGWGSGANSSLGHRGKDGLSELENPSVTFLLVQATNPPAPGDDLDANGNGTIDTAVRNQWTLLDSVGVLDADGAGDMAYGEVNFRLDTLPGSGASASGAVVAIPFVPRYLGRAGNSVGKGGSDWVAAGTLAGNAPQWRLDGTSNTYPAAFANQPLNHLGAPNFGAPPLAGVLVLADRDLVVSEAGGRTSYRLALNTSPAGPVTLRLASGPQLEISVDGGLSFGPSREVVLANTSPRTITVRSLDDQVVGASPHWSWVEHQLMLSSDLIQYPLTTLIPEVRVGIVENDGLLLSEVKVNPPGTSDEPYEFVEVRGEPGLWLTNVLLLAIEGNLGEGPGTISYLLDLSGSKIGAGGLLVVAAPNHPYSIPPSATVVADPRLSAPGSTFGNGTFSLMLVSCEAPLSAGVDLDKGNNGTLSGLPGGATILDSIGWRDGNDGDLVYGGAELVLPQGIPDAATRFSGDHRPNTASAWFCGDLAGVNGDSLVYDTSRVSTNFIPGTALAPGQLAQTGPAITYFAPVSGVIGDFANPRIEFVVSQPGLAAERLLVTASSANPAVVPDRNLVVETGSDGWRSLNIQPLGVGYAELTLSITDGIVTNRLSFPYAASAMGRAGGSWHLGASDASTAIEVGAEHMLVGDDENQTLRLYRRHASGTPISQWDLGPWLALPDARAGVPREVDIEASTRVGNRVYWIGSLGHAADGESRTNRTRVFATDLSGTGSSVQVTYAGRYDFLKLDLIEWDRRNLHGKGTNYYGLDASDAPGVPPKAPDGSGFAIEGLSMMPGSTDGAFVAFRAPLVPPGQRTHALIVPIVNFAAVAASLAGPGSAQFGPPIELDLYGRGIRSIEGSGTNYLLVAGPPSAELGPYPRDFRLYTWTGRAADQPEQRAVDLAGLRPEAVVQIPPAPWTAETPFELLSDEGATEFYGDGTPAKLLEVPNFRKFRSDTLRLGGVVKPAPIIVSTSLGSAGLVITWRALAGLSYQLQVSADPGSGQWDTMPGVVVAPGPYASAKILVEGGNRFYRVMIFGF
jgi:hypothetical protein